MTLRLTFTKSVDDNMLCGWVDVKSVVVEIPDSLKDYHFQNAEVIEEEESK